MCSRARKMTLPCDFELSWVRMRVRKMSLLIGKRVSLTTGSSTILGGVLALAICPTLRMARDILSVTRTRSCDSTPVPATNPRSSAFISVTGMPDGFLTPEDAQPVNSAEAQSNETTVVFFFMLGLIKGEPGIGFNDQTKH